MVLYKKAFPLSKGISFFQYITALRKGYFPNFVVTIDKIPQTENYRGQIFFTAPHWWQRGWRSGYSEGVFLKECTIQPSKDEKYFTLQASPTTGNLFLALLEVLFSILAFVFVIFTIVTNDGMSLNNIFGFAIIIIIMLAPLILICLQDKNLLDKVGSLGMNLEKN